MPTIFRSWNARAAELLQSQWFDLGELAAGTGSFCGAFRANAYHKPALLNDLLTVTAEVKRVAGAVEFD